MKLQHAIVFIFTLLPLLLHAQKDNGNPKETITADSAKRSIVELLNELAKKHPGFYRYNTKAQFDKYIDSSLSTINGPQTQIDFYRKLKPIIARIRCVHTTISLSDKYVAYLNVAANMIPFDVHFIGDKAYITGNYSGEPSLSPGTELLSINDKPIKEVKKILFDMISSDGFNETLKYQLINKRFAQSYRLNIEAPDHFKVTVLTDDGIKEMLINGVKSETIPLPDIMDLKNKLRLNFQLKDQSAVLTVKSFGETDIKAGGQNFGKFVTRVFDELQTAQVKNLIIDLRDNTGGTDINAALLSSYLMNKPYRYWDRIEVTEPFALSIKGSARFMYGRPVKKDSVYLWQKSRFTREFDFFEPQQSQAKAYRGKVFVLINGACLSSCADLVAILQYNERAVLIGEEAGGGYQGNNSGLIPDSKMSFGINVSVPLLKYINSVDQTNNYGHGAYPDFPYIRTLSDILQKRDPEMTMVLKLVQ